MNQRIIQICLFLLGAISLLGASLQLYLGQPTSPSADNIHRFMAGIYFSMGPLLIWTGIIIRKHDHLIFFSCIQCINGRYWQTDIYERCRPS